MIDFTPDGPFAEKADQLFPDRVRILGLGQTGVSACDQLVLHGRSAQDIWAFDSDQLAIEGSVVSNRHLLGRNLVRGLGCGGDLELAREIVALEEGRLAPVARGCDFLILVLGLGGATGVALTEHMIELGREAGAKVIVVGVQPFACEGWSRRKKATAAVAALRRNADSVLVLAHDRIAECPATVKNIRHGYHLMHQLLAQTAQALAQVVCKRGLIQLSFADVRSLYGRYAGTEVLENCWMAHVEGDAHDRTEDLIAQLLAAPLLSDESVWKQVDHAIVAVSGTRELGLLDVQEMVGALKDRMPVNIPIVTSASLDDDSHDKVRMTVLLAMTAPAPRAVESSTVRKEPAPFRAETPVPEIKALPEPVEQATLEPSAAPAPVKKARPAAKPKPVPALVDQETVTDGETISFPEVESAATTSQPIPLTTRPSGRFNAKQEEMQFDGPTRGRFEKTHETMYNGENLDQPTFRRRRLKIRV
jgi:cell division protein FtsZ